MLNPFGRRGRSKSENSVMMHVTNPNQYIIGQQSGRRSEEFVPHPIQNVTLKSISSWRADTMIIGNGDVRNCITSLIEIGRTQCPLFVQRPGAIFGHVPVSKVEQYVFGAEEVETEVVEMTVSSQRRTLTATYTIWQDNLKFLIEQAASNAALRAMVVFPAQTLSAGVVMDSNRKYVGRLIGIGPYGPLPGEPMIDLII